MADHISKFISTPEAVTDFSFEDPLQRSLCVGIISLITIIGIPGNLFVIICVLRLKRLQTKTNVFSESRHWKLATIFVRI